MDVVIVIAVVAAALLLTELLLPTGGALAVIGAAGFIAAGLVALGEDSSEVADYVGPALITLGVLSAGTFFVVTPKILKAHRDEPVRTGWEELVGREAEVREPLDPVGQVWIEGALWRARVGDGAAAIPPGNRVLVEKVDGLTLVVGPVAGTQTDGKE
jgi:membrane-bound serine protease (ClpP class)